MELFQLFKKTNQNAASSSWRISVHKMKMPVWWLMLSVALHAQSLVIKIFLIQVLNFKQLCWLVSNNTRRNGCILLTRDWLLCRSSAARAPSLNTAQLCCIPLQHPVVPFPAFCAIFPNIQTMGNLTGITKCIVKFYLFSSLLLFLWMRNLLFAFKGANKVRKK